MNRKSSRPFSKRIAWISFDIFFKFLSVHFLAVLLTFHPFHAKLVLNLKAQCNTSLKGSRSGTRKQGGLTPLSRGIHAIQTGRGATGWVVRTGWSPFRRKGSMIMTRNVIGHSLSEIYPCPFCGGMEAQLLDDPNIKSTASLRAKGLIFGISELDTTYYDGAWFVKCPDCFAEGPRCTTEARALELWTRKLLFCLHIEDIKGPIGEQDNE
jgi:hypothetical protein